MRFRPLASSSGGNAYLLEDGFTSILIECGLSQKKLMQKLGFQLSQLHGVLVSHEHKDHSGCARKLIESGIDVWMSQGTALALELPETLLELAHGMQAGEQFTVGTMTVLPFGTFHDAQEPLGFVIQSAADGDIFAYAIDTVNLPYRFPGVGLLAVEANFDKAILERCQRMPEKTRARIANTHMEIDVLCACLRRMDLAQCREIYLLHLSDATSHEGHFINKVRRAVPRHVAVTACGRESTEEV